MSDTINDGGPAFPQTYCPTSEGRVESPWSDGLGGLSARDVFAIFATVSPAELDDARKREHARMLADKTCMYQERDDRFLEAEIRYRKADAMLKARQSTPDTPAPEADEGE